MVDKTLIITGIGFLLFWSYLLRVSLFRKAHQDDDVDYLIELKQQAKLLNDLIRRETEELEKVKLKYESFKANKVKLNKVSSPTREWIEPIPVLVFVCSRPKAVENHINKLLKHRPSKEKFPIIVSQDCDNDAVREVVKKFGDEVEYVKHSSGENAHIVVPPNHRRYKTYYYISRHYKLGLEHVFNEKKHSSVIITEDDLDIAPDFFEYFSATRYLLDNDPYLWCVSAWNDNGKIGNIENGANSKLYRSDFFPGLGWMMSSKTWKELGPIWPEGFWDDWMREPVTRKNRQCIRPEISRTGMTADGKDGASLGQFFSTHLAKIVVNRRVFNFTQTNLDYLLHENYDPKFEKEVFVDSKSININDVQQYVKDSANKGSSIRIEYNGNMDYIDKADVLRIMHDFKAGVPRTAYKGVVTCSINGVRVFLVPDRDVIHGYDPKWFVPAGKE